MPEKTREQFERALDRVVQARLNVETFGPSNRAEYDNVRTQFVAEWGPAKANGQQLALVPIVSDREGPISEAVALAYLREMVFSYWRAKMHAGNPRIRWTVQRKVCVDARLKFYDLDPNACLYAIAETAKDPHRMGENDRNRAFNDITSIFRNDSVCDELANRNAAYVAGKPHPFIALYMAKYPPPGGSQ